MSSDLLKTLGTDENFLEKLPRGGSGREWEPAWKNAIRNLYVAGLSPVLIVQELPYGPTTQTIHTWARENDWDIERDRFQKQVTAKALAVSEEPLVDVNARHIKALKGAQLAALSAIAGRTVQAKTLEGTISALVTAISAERKVRGLGAPEIELNTATFNLSNLGVDLDLIEKLPPEQREEALELQRQRIEIQAKINALASGGTIIVENTNGQNHPVESGGDGLDAPMP